MLDWYRSNILKKKNEHEYLNSKEKKILYFKLNVWKYPRILIIVVNY